MKKTHKKKVNIDDIIYDELLECAIRDSEERLRRLPTIGEIYKHLKLDEAEYKLYMSLDLEGRMKYDEFCQERMYTGWAKPDDSIGNITLKFRSKDDISKLLFELEAL